MQRVTITEDREAQLAARLLQFEETLTVVARGDGTPHVMCLPVRSGWSVLRLRTLPYSLSAENESVRNSRLKLAQLTAKNLKQGLDTPVSKPSSDVGGDFAKRALPKCLMAFFSIGRSNMPCSVNIPSNRESPSPVRTASKSAGSGDKSRDRCPSWSQTTFGTACLPPRYFHDTANRFFSATSAYPRQHSACAPAFRTP